MRKWRTRYARRARTGPRLEAITAGASRRRGPRLHLVAVGATLVAALVAVAFLTGSGPNHTAGGAAVSKSSGTLSADGERSKSSHTTDRAQLQKETAAINHVLGYTPYLANGMPRRRMIALTFDDGPSPYTPQVLRILLRMHVPATFFIVGLQLHAFSAGVREEIRHGFTVGDHTQNHSMLTQLGAGGQLGQISEAAVGVQHLGAPFPRLFRPPYGAYNQQTLATLKRLRMLMVMWSIDPGDWRRPGVGPIVKNVLANARPGAVVIMHDGGGDRSQTVAALPQIINGLRKRHYQLVSVPQLLISDPPPRHQRVPSLTGA